MGELSEPSSNWMDEMPELIGARLPESEPDDYDRSLAAECTFAAIGYRQIEGSKLEHFVRRHLPEWRLSAGKLCRTLSDHEPPRKITCDLMHDESGGYLVMHLLVDGDTIELVPDEGNETFTGRNLMAALAINRRLAEEAN